MIEKLDLRASVPAGIHDTLITIARRQWLIAQKVNEIIDALTANEITQDEFEGLEGVIPCQARK